MRFLLTKLPGVLRIDAEPHGDARGLFTRLYCPEEMAGAGIAGFETWQISLSRNPTRHTMRGRVYEVVIDLRRDSPRCGEWIAMELDAGAMNAVFVPEGCAHGYLTLQPDTDVMYQISPLHVPGKARGVRWNDPAFAVRWPAEPVLMDARDACWPDWIAPRTAAWLTADL